MEEIVLIGYSGHGYVAGEILLQDYDIKGYCESEELIENPLDLFYYGNEKDSAIQKLLEMEALPFFPAIRNNRKRQKVTEELIELRLEPVNAISETSEVSALSKMGKGIMVAPNVIVHPGAEIGNGVILNTSSIIGDRTQIGAYSHVAPGAVIAGRVKVGKRCFIGANTVVRERVEIGDGATVGAGSVVLRDIPPGETWAGNPAKKIR